MHKYLKSIGFSKLWSIQDEEELIADVLKNYDYKKIVEDEYNQKYAQISKEYLPGSGVTVYGYYDEDKLFHMSHYFPFHIGTSTINCPQVIIEKQASGLYYVGACDDIRVGTTLIYFLLNADNFINAHRANIASDENMPLSLSGLAEEARILLPVKNKASESSNEQQFLQERNSLYDLAASGNEDAIENLTKQDINTYTMISRRLMNEDVYSIVDTYFMPYGLECDLYNIMGDITRCERVQNDVTGEYVWMISIQSNGIPIDLCVNEEDLTGEPRVGRRFKGIVWLQGMLNF